MLLNNEQNGLLLMPRPHMFIKSSSRSVYLWLFWRVHHLSSYLKEMDSHLVCEHLSRLWGRSKCQRCPPLAWALKLWFRFIWYSRSITSPANFLCSPFPLPKTDWDKINWPYKTSAACVAYQVDYELCYLKTLETKRLMISTTYFRFMCGFN